MSFPSPERTAALLETLPETASLWFAFGGHPDDPQPVLVDRATDPRGQAFLPQVKALANEGPVSRGVASRKAGASLRVVSKTPFPGLVGALARWTASHALAHPALLGLDGLVFTLVNEEKQVVERQEDPSAWQAVADTLAAAKAASPEDGPAETGSAPATADPHTAQAAAALASGASSLWLWLEAASTDASRPPLLVLVRRDEDPRGAAFAAAVKQALAEGHAKAGSLQGILNLSKGKAPRVVSRGAYTGFVAALIRWHKTWSGLEGVSRIKGVGFSQVSKDKTLLDEQIDPGAWDDAEQQAAREAGTTLPVLTEAEQSAAALEAAEGDDQLWFWLGTQDTQVAVVLRTVESDPNRSGFDRAVTAARQTLGEAPAEAVGRARRDAGGGFRFQCLAAFPGFTRALQGWVTTAGAEAPGLGALVGSRFQYVNPDGAVFNEQPWPSGSSSPRAAAPPAEASPEPSAPGEATGLPVSPKEPSAQRALDGTWVNLGPARTDAEESLSAAADLAPRDLQRLAQDLEALAGSAESWLEQLADLDDARFETRARRRDGWSGTGPSPGLPALPGDPAVVAEAVRDLGADLQDAATAAQDWLKKAQGPPLSARTPLALPVLSLSPEVRAFLDAVQQRDVLLDQRCASATATADPTELASLDEEAADARDAVLTPLLDLAADAGETAIALRRACDKLESHGEFRTRFPDAMRAKFDARLGEAHTGLRELTETLLWLTRPRE